MSLGLPKELIHFISKKAQISKLPFFYVEIYTYL